MSKKWIIIGILICFFVGAYTWKIAYTGRHTARNEKQDLETTQIPLHATLVYVGEEPISSEDLEWEFDLQTKGLEASEELTPTPDLGPKLDQALSPLKERLLASMIERKVLYHFVGQDPEFDLSISARYTGCLEEWQTSLKETASIAKTNKDQERLKSRLCEQSILDQYLEERVYPKIQVKDEELLQYYNDNKNEFRSPEKAIVRQIVLANENDAKRVFGKVKGDNFEEYAREYSIAPEATQGGLVGAFARGQMPSFFDVAFSMRPGEINGIIKSHYGFHIIKLEKKIPKVSLGYSEAQPKIRDLLLKKKKEEEYKKWVEIALNAIPVKTPKPLW